MLRLEKLSKNLKTKILLFTSLAILPLALFAGQEGKVDEKKKEEEVIQKEKHDITFIYPKNAVVNGGVFKFVMKGSCKLEILFSRFENHDLYFYRNLESEKKSINTDCQFESLVGVPYETSAGKPKVILKIKQGEKTYEDSFEIAVVEGVYRSEKLTVKPNKVKPNPKDIPRIQRDRVHIAKAYENTASVRIWKSPAILPIDNIITSPYGSARVYNDIKDGVHFGTDFRAAVGTPIKNPLEGKVVLAKNLFFTGNTIILDHGVGLFSFYGHMSKFKVKVGQIIPRGKVLGLSGATGRVSGPHLHWGINLHGTKVDPMQLVELLNREEKEGPR